MQHSPNTSKAHLSLSHSLMDTHTDQSDYKVMHIKNISAKSDRRRIKLKLRKKRSSPMTCKTKSHPKSVVAAPEGSSDVQISSSSQQK